MERRDFIKKSAIGSSCALAGAFIPESAAAADKSTEYKVKITVLKKILNADWNQEYRNKEGINVNCFLRGRNLFLSRPGPISELSYTWFAKANTKPLCPAAPMVSDWFLLKLNE